MFYENRLMDMVNEYKNSFTHIYNEYRKNCSGNDVSFSEWLNNRNRVLKELEEEINSISDVRFKKRVVSLSNKDSFKEIEKGFNFTKLCYFIDNLNKEKKSNKILKYNPEYCDSILIHIAYEYVRIKSYLDDESKRLSKVNSKEFNEASNRIINVWNQMYTNRLEAIINDEYKILIQEIENKV